jgi:trehalose/maltose hydrolase-like predicted phosphorylase
MAVAASSRAPGRERPLPRELDRRFEAVVFDWDGTAVPDRHADARRLRALVERLCPLGMDLIVVTGTHVGNVDGQLQARPSGPGRLDFCVNRGSEVYRASDQGLELVYRREATDEENAQLDAAAAAAVEAFARLGLHAEVVSQRLNRRKIDLIPEPEWADPPKARIGELLAAVEARLRAAGIAGLSHAVDIALDASASAGLADPRVTSDAKHIEIGLTDKSDSARWAIAELWTKGIGPNAVLVAGDEFGDLGGLRGSDSFLLVAEDTGATVVSVGAEPAGTPPGVLALAGGPKQFLRVLEDQLRRRVGREVPDVPSPDGWTFSVKGFSRKFERVYESLLTLADGRLGTRGSPIAGDGITAPGVVYSGVYDGEGPEEQLAPLAEWSRLRKHDEIRPKRRVLDLHAGLLREEGPLTSLRFSSLARPGTVALRAAGDAKLLPRGRRWTAPGPVGAAFADARRNGVFERIGVYEPDVNRVEGDLARAHDDGFERLLYEHREAWARRWREAEIVIDGDDELQREVRFALFHLVSSVADNGEAAVAARGLSGPAYRGHVFWDSDAFVLPFVAATHPAAARAMLEYRVRRLPAACEEARRLERAGARFPWESAGSGFDVTPTGARLPDGGFVPIRTGELEEHIVADVAWAAAFYVNWTGDEEFAQGPGRELLVETARYWASRVRLDQDGVAHIYGVIGPDEYHEPVDDNAFTNVMARWNLRRAAALAGIAPKERNRWKAVADALADGYDARTGIYEQFSGFFGLEPIVIAELAPRRPVAADMLLGPERTRQAQVLKQADVLMLHHLVPDEVAPDSLLPNLEFYEPRTAHGSSLSPAIHAGLLARARRFPQALDLLRIAARIDLDDLTGSTAGGLHLATMGGLWQALAFGFAGVRMRNGRLVVDPRLPPEWNALELALRHRGEPFRLRIEARGVEIDSETLGTRRVDDHWEVVRR